MAGMHKMFKTPSDIGSAKDLLQGLKKALKVLKKSEDSMRFLLKGESFEFTDEQPGAMLFLGVFKGDWKKYAKAQKAETDFASGFCKLNQQKPGDLVLMLEATSGKGRKDKFLKSLNKGVLKKLKLRAIFVDSLEADASESQVQPSKTEDVVDEQKEKIALLKADYQEIRHHFDKFKALLQTKEADGAKREVDLLMDLIEEWLELSQELKLDPNSKEAQHIKNIKATIEKNEEQILLKESRAKILRLNQLIKEFEELPETELEKGMALQEEIEDLIEDIEDIGLPES